MIIPQENLKKIVAAIVQDTIGLLRLGLDIDQIKEKVQANGTEVILEADELMEITALVWNHYDLMKCKNPDDLWPYLCRMVEVN